MCTCAIFSLTTYIEVFFTVEHDEKISGKMLSTVDNHGYARAVCVLGPVHAEPMTHAQ